MLKIKDLSKAFGDHQVLKNITFDIDESHIVGLAGSSGSGKSTLLRIIQGLEKQDSGTLNIKLNTGFMFQDFQLFPHMNVWKNIIYSPSINNQNDDFILRAKDLIECLGLSAKINSYPHQLSGGQKQRVALARSLMMQPEMLLCDEPTSGLDVATIEDVISLLKSIKDMGVSMIIASHDLDFLTKIANKIFVLKNGILIDSVYPEEMNDPINYLKKLY